MGRFDREITEGVFCRPAHDGQTFRTSSSIRSQYELRRRRILAGVLQLQLMRVDSEIGIHTVIVYGIIMTIPQTCLIAS